MGVKNIVKKVGEKAGNKIAKLSSLSSDQVENIQFQRENYLLEKPDPNDEVALVRTERLMAASSIEIFNAFLPQIKDLYLPVNKNAEYNGAFDVEHNIRYFNITKWVTDKKENNLEKLVNVYAVLSNEDCNIALVFNRTQNNTKVYLAVVNTKNTDNNVDVEMYKSRLIEAIRGNFPGAEWSNEGTGIVPCLNNDKLYSVASASNIPTEKSEKFISQTIEKLLDGIVPDTKKKEYTIVLLATPIQDVEERKLKLGEFYSGMAPYASWQTSFMFSENNSMGSTATVGVNVGASAGIQNGQNYAKTNTDGTSDSSASTNTDSQSVTDTDGTSEAQSSSGAHSEGTSSTDTKTKGASDTVGVNGGIDTKPFKIGGHYDHNMNHSVAKALGKTASDTLTKGLTTTVSKSLAHTTGKAIANTLGKAVTSAMAKTAGTAKSVNFGGNFGANFARSSTVTTTVGKNEGITQTFTNFNIKHALELLENHMKRLEQSTALGMWDFAAYVLCEDQNVANNVAHTYLALTMGEESYMSKSAINLWRGNVDEDKEKAKVISGYVRELRHPIFGINPEIIETDAEFNEYPSIVTATTSLSGKELAYSLNFPQKSISGLPILECAEFARNVVTYDHIDEEREKISLGNIFHMNHKENNRVNLSEKSMASHTFITGSTGSGKSNTVFQILENAKKKDTKFLVIEPAKGEYKNVFGNDIDVSVYGTNQLITPLLRINPFSFPKEIHVLEHLDRLVEIFNVCWPMYAAMPAVLKNGIEKSYMDCGWNLLHSSNKYEEDLYPTFADVARNIKEIIDTSEYDNENKGAYKGSLLTRLQSLTNGINGMIFTADEISDIDLFDKNVIIDLSRVGSSETKALIMGMLVLKLQEYRMASCNKMNSELKHITVLEEAHNLLRKTSTEQSADGANLLGKSVEMLANAIAEMRTYGEGFIIADQAPGLMDMSVIRNTNTKIIMRLPDQSDRELVGKAANLNDDQIKELAKLPCGVAAVYQNEWVQSVLCKVDKNVRAQTPFFYLPGKKEDTNTEIENVSQSLLHCIMNKEIFKKGNREDIQKLKKMVIKSKLDTTVKCDFMEYIGKEKDDGLEALRVLIYDFLAAEEAIKASRQCNNISDWVHSVVEKLEPSVKDYSKKQIDLTMALIINEQATRDESYHDILGKYTEVYKSEGGVL